MSKIIKPGDRAFYINRKRYVEIESHVEVGVEGFYAGRAIKPGFGVTREFGFKVPCKNLITNVGMDALGTAPSFSRMHLGTGTAAPQDTDTTLGNFGVAVGISGSVTGGAQGSAPYFGWTQIVWTSDVGGATGAWTEIGISNQGTDGNLRSRALILDQGGQPTAFPVLADEQFQGSYMFRVYVPTADESRAITMSGDSYDAVTRALSASTANIFSGGWQPSINTGVPLFGHNPGAQSSANAYTGGLSAITSANPLGSSLGAGTMSTATYSAGTHYLDIAQRFGSGQAVGAIRTVKTMCQCGSFQTEYDPVINKLTTEEVIHNQRVSWARR